MLGNTVDNFVELVTRSGLISAPALNLACAGFDTTRTDSNAVGELCQHLVDERALTPWQCEKLRQGKFKGFFLDGYCILRQLSVNETTSTYLCKEVASGKQVAMEVTPPTHSADRKFHYEISDLPNDSSNSSTPWD